MKVRVKEWQTAAFWQWDVRDPDDVCGICQNNFDGVCGNCKEPGDACPLLFGECTHEFHLHCIMKWLQANESSGGGGQCPMCKRPWKEATASTHTHASLSPASTNISDPS